MSIACFNYLPPIFLLILFGGSYFVYVYNYCVCILKGLHNRIAFLLLINICSIMLLWSFFVTMLSSVGRVPIEYKFTRSEHNTLRKASTDDQKDEILEIFCERKHLLLQTCTPIGSIRYCVTCMLVKPDRTHHCRTCQTCFLKMDHHCPWVNNCIGFKNYKSFILLVFYTVCYCFSYIITTIGYIIDSMEHSRFSEDLPISVGFGLAIIMFLVAFGFLLYHFYLIGINETTLENVHPPNFVEDNMTFDLGAAQNFREVFGDRCYLWLLPVFSSMGCGHMFLVERK